MLLLFIIRPSKSGMAILIKFPQANRYSFFRIRILHRYLETRPSAYRNTQKSKKIPLKKQAQAAFPAGFPL